MYESLKDTSLPVSFQSIAYHIKFKIKALMEEFYNKHQVKSLLSKVLHEIKTSFVSVDSNVELLRDILNSETKLENKELLNKVVKFIKEKSSLGKQNSDMFLKSVESIKGMQIAKERLSLKECLEQALAEYRFEHNSKNNVNLNIAEDFEFIGDREGFKYIIFNLLRNSFMHNGFSVKIDITSKGNQLIYQDNGVGIAKENLPRIFDNHFTTNEKGLGLGLSFCKRMMETMGGKIECESEKGSYTKFTLTLSKLLTLPEVKK